MVLPGDVLAFWFEESGPEQWFAKNDAFDAAIKERFSETVDKLAREVSENGKSSWEETPLGALATIIVLDQFPRNIYRGTAEAFSRDPLALGATKRAIEAKFDDELESDHLKFLYMPLMHSEELEDQELCVKLFETRLDDPDSLKFAIVHRDIIRDFGLFPHRNDVLGRPTTPEQQAFLDEGGFSG